MKNKITIIIIALLAMTAPVSAQDNRFCVGIESSFQTMQYQNPDFRIPFGKAFNYDMEAFFGYDLFKNVNVAMGVGGVNLNALAANLVSRKNHLNATVAKADLRLKYSLPLGASVPFIEARYGLQFGVGGKSEISVQSIAYNVDLFGSFFEGSLGYAYSFDGKLLGLSLAFGEARTIYKNANAEQWEGKGKNAQKCFSPYALVRLALTIR